MNSNSTNNSIYLKIAALLTVVKWKTVVLTALAQYIAFLFAFNNQNNLEHSLHEWKVHLIILSTALFISAGNILNNFYDAERDLVNRPNKARFQHLVSRSFTLKLYMLLNTLGTAIAFYASWRIGIFFIVFGIGLWFYSHKLSKMVFIGEFAASLLAVTAFFSLILYFHTFNIQFLTYGYTLFIVLFSREIYKAIKSIKGDIVFGYSSIATTIGITPSIRIMQVLLALSLLSDGYLIYGTDKLPLMITLATIMLAKIITISITAKEVVMRKKWVNKMFQLIIAIYILGIAWL